MGGLSELIPTIDILLLSNLDFIMDNKQRKQKCEEL